MNKKSEKGPATYTSLKGLMGAKTKGTAPKGIKVSIDNDRNTAVFKVKDSEILSIDVDDFMAAGAKALGFAVEK